MDNKNLKDGRDRNRVARDEDYEIRHVSEKFGVSRQQVMDAIKAVGNTREAVENYLRGKSGEKSKKRGQHPI